MALSSGLVGLLKRPSVTAGGAMQQPVAQCNIRPLQVLGLNLTFGNPSKSLSCVQSMALNIRAVARITLLASGSFSSAPESRGAEGQGPVKIDNPPLAHDSARALSAVDFLGVVLRWRNRRRVRNLHESLERRSVGRTPPW